VSDFLTRLENAIDHSRRTWQHHKLTTVGLADAHNKGIQLFFKGFSEYLERSMPVCLVPLRLTSDQYAGLARIKEGSSVDLVLDRFYLRDHVARFDYRVPEEPNGRERTLDDTSTENNEVTGKLVWSYTTQRVDNASLIALDDLVFFFTSERITSQEHADHLVLHHQREDMQFVPSGERLHFNVPLFLGPTIDLRYSYIGGFDTDDRTPYHIYGCNTRLDIDISSGSPDVARKFLLGFR